MLYKIIAIERMQRQLESGDRHAVARFRQIFVTQSGKLVDKVKGYYEKTQAFFSSEGKTRSRPDIVERNSDDAGLYEQDDEEYSRVDLPKKFSDLKDEHFPLIITYHLVCFHVV